MLWTLDGKYPVGTPRMQIGSEFVHYPGMNETPTRVSNIVPGGYGHVMYMDPALFHDNISLAYLNQSQSILDMNVDHRASRIEMNPHSKYQYGNTENGSKVIQTARKDDGP